MIGKFRDLSIIQGMRDLLMQPVHLLCIAGVIAGCLLTGCETGPHSSPNAPRVTLVPDNRVILEPAVVTIDDGMIQISGSLHRQPTLSGPMSGRVDIEFISPDGDLLDELPALITPHDVSDGHPCTYRTAPYAYIPPKGSTLRIHFIDSATETREDIAGAFSDYDSGGGGGAAAGGAAHGNEGKGTHGQMGGNNHYASHGGGFGGGFGNVNFSPNGRH
jgi:hypothetical protein